MSRLEQKNFIECRPDENDRRSKRIYILPRGLQVHETMHHTMDATEAQLVQGFSPEEARQFEALLLRAIHNMGESPCKRKHKEEPQE